MKKTFTLKKLSTAIIAAFLFAGMNAQVTINVPADFATLDAAMRSIATNPAVANDSEVIVNITESIQETTETTTWNFGFTGLKITVKGQGVATVVNSKLGEKPSLTEANGNRYVQIGTASSTHTGLQLTFQDITFKNFGTAFTANAQGSFLNFFVSPSAQWNAIITFRNVVVEDCVGRAIIRGTSASTTVGELEFILDNCYFTNNVSTVGDPLTTKSPLKGIILFDAGGKFRIKNCTFFNNSTFDNNSRSNGSLVSFDVNYGVNADILFEGNQFLNNLYTSDSPAGVIQPLISIKPIHNSTNRETATLTFKNNEMIGNARTGNLNDIGLLYTRPDYVTITAESTGNFINSAKKEVSTGVYEDVVLPESTIDAALTYTSPAVNYVMNGDVPALTPDEFGIPRATKDGTVAVFNAKSNLFSVFPNPSNGDVFIVSKDVELPLSYELYNVVGKMVKTGVISSYHDQLFLTEKAGMYMLRLQSASGEKNAIRLILK